MNYRGFTLIELLLSISIIGILSAVFFANLSGYRERTRDTVRKKDLLRIQTGLETYRADAGAYPTNLPSCDANLTVGSTVYINDVPCDPTTSPTWGTQYFYSSTGNAYSLYACLENGNDQERDSTKKSGCSSANASYTVISP